MGVKAADGMGEPPLEKGIERAQEEKKRKKWKENKEWRGKKDSL